MLGLARKTPKTLKSHISRSEVLRNEQVRELLKRGLPKSDVRYWKQRIRLPVYTDQNGNTRESPHYSVCVSFKKQRRNLSLQTGSKDQAAKAGLELWEVLRRDGWDAALAKLRPGPVVAKETIGQIIQALEAVLEKNPTTTAYVRSLRYVCGEALGIKRHKAKPKATIEEPVKQRRRRKKHPLEAGISKWGAAVDALPLAENTPAKVEQWRTAYKAERDQEMDKQRSAKVSVNSWLRSCKSLLSPDNLKKAGLQIVSPFAEIKYEKIRPSRYVSKFSAKELFDKAERELGPEELKALMLGLFAGLRRTEADMAIWSWFNWQKNQLEITPHKFFEGKTQDSGNAVIPMDPSIMGRFWKLYEAGTNPEAGAPVANGEHLSDFVIESDSWAKGKVSKSYHRTRTETVFRRLTDWLRQNGVTARRAFHELRKESGSIVNAAQGVFSASRHLRHSNIQITAGIYCDDRAMQPIRLSDLSG